MRALILLSFALVMAGCSKTASPPPGNAASAAPVAAAPSGAGGSSSGGDVGACGLPKISAADVQPLLSGQITSAKPAPSDPNSCVFATAGFSMITVALHPGEGKQTLEIWRKGPATPVPGVGDDAVWDANIQEIVAAKGDTLCTVAAMGPEVTPATAETEGALCNKLFAGI